MTSPEPEMVMSAERFAALWRSLSAIGRAPDGGYHRLAFTADDSACREWFVEEALDRDLDVKIDGNGNIFAWWEDPVAAGPGAGGAVAAGPGAGGAVAAGPGAGGAVLTGSHLDSVPGGGGYDGALGVVAGLLAVDLLRERGATPRRPIGIAVFADEEGARFGVPCLGSRLLTGALDAARAGRLRDRDGITLPVALAGLRNDLDPDPGSIGADPDLLARLGAFVELHIEQGRSLAEAATGVVTQPGTHAGTQPGAAVGVGTGVWPHGRWRLEITGTPDHAGTAPMAGRHDPMLTLAFAVLAANKEARLRGARATVGRVRVDPDASNVIATTVAGWLDARAADEDTLVGMVDAIIAKVTERADRDGTTLRVAAESVTPPVKFHTGLIERLVAALRRDQAGEAAADPPTLATAANPPTLATAAGHDAAVLAAWVPAAMLFVRNPSGVSHAPGEYATDADCAAGITALADVLEELACH